MQAAHFGNGILAAVTSVWLGARNSTRSNPGWLLFGNPDTEKGNVGQACVD